MARKTLVRPGFEEAIGNDLKKISERSTKTITKHNAKKPTMDMIASVKNSKYEKQMCFSVLTFSKIVREISNEVVSEPGRWRTGAFQVYKYKINFRV